MKDHGATGNSSFGYILGGNVNPGGAVSNVQRIDYSNDTETASPKGPLSAATRYTGSFSSKANAVGTDAQSIWKDTSKNGDNATVEGATHQDANSGSFAFNGTSNYASNDDKANLQLGSGNFTFSAWIKPNPTLQGTDYGYFAGGATPSKVSSIDRLDYMQSSIKDSQ